MIENKEAILVVDDDVETRETYAQLLAKHGFYVLQAKDGVEGLDIVTSFVGIDAVFTGIIMPRMDGFQLFAAMKNNTATSSIPVIINSHLGREEDKKRALEMGAKDFIIRGTISPNEVIKRVMHALRRKGQYVLKIDPLDPQIQKLVEDQNLPENLSCDNCGTTLALKLESNQKKELAASFLCPNCQRRY